MASLITYSLVLLCGRQKLKRLVSLLASTQLYCLILMYSLEGWGYLAASKKAKRTILLHSLSLYFISLVPKFPYTLPLRSSVAVTAAAVWPSCGFIEVIFPFPPLCLEHVCMVSWWVSTTSVWVPTVFGYLDYPGHSWISGTAPLSCRKAEITKCQVLERLTDKFMFRSHTIQHTKFAIPFE